MSEWRGRGPVSRAQPYRPQEGTTQCTALPQEGASVDVVASTDPVPTAAGGSIVSGTYLLTTAKVYGSQAADGTKVLTVGKVTLKFTGTAFETIVTDDKAKETRSTGTAAAAGTNLTLTTTCQFPAPAKAPAVATYTATATTLTVISPFGTGTIAQLYTKK